MEFSKVTQAIIEKLSAIAGSVITDRDKMIDYSHDEFAMNWLHHFPEVVVKPETAGQISEIMKLASQENIPVTPRGGATGLCGGCVPVHGGIVVSFERMNRVLEVDKDNLIAVAEPGASLTDFYEAVGKAGLFFPPHPGDEGATLGGVVATNAGGARAVKYGVIRNFVKGLEVVLPSGEIIQLGGKLIKSSTGYSLMHLMIGSEGTLGIVTKVFVNLFPPPHTMYTLVAPYDDLAQAIQTVPAIIQNRILPMAVEFVEHEMVMVSEDFIDKKWPCRQGKAHLMIIIDGSSEDEALAQAEKVGELCEENGALDVFVADTQQKQQEILEIRSQIYEATRNHMVEILDLTVPRAEIGRFVSGVHQVSEQTGIWLPNYGHAADGNVHTNIMNATWKDGEWTETPGWKEKYPEARDRLHEIARQCDGIVSGEHGIGAVKKEYVRPFLGEKQVELMQAIKGVFDPKGILNPGKIF